MSKQNIAYIGSLEALGFLQSSSRPDAHETLLYDEDGLTQDTALLKNSPHTRDPRHIRPCPSASLHYPLYLNITLHIPIYP